MKMNTASSLGSRTLPGNTITNPKEDLKGITTHSGTPNQGPTIITTSSSLPQVVERDTEVTKDTMPPTNNGSTKDVQPSVVQIKTLIPNFEPVVAPIIEPVVALVSASKPNQKPLILYPSRLHDQKLRDKANDQKDPTIKTLLTNKDKLFELARTLLNKHCSVVLLKKLPEKLGDPDKFLIPCDFSGMDECLALADLGASINLMPLSVWNKLSLLELSATCMALELADRSISRPVGVAEDVFVKVGTFHFSADFIVVDFDADPRVPLILRRSFLKTGRALIDGDILLLEAFLNDDPSLPPPNQGKYLPQVRKELKICEAKNDKSLIDEPPDVKLKDLPPHLEYVFLKGDDKLHVIISKDLSDEEKTALIKVLNIAKDVSVKVGVFHFSADFMVVDFKPDPRVPLILRRCFLKTGRALIDVHKGELTLRIGNEAITYNLDQTARYSANYNQITIHDVIKKEVEKLLDAGLIYPISDSPWVSPLHCVPKKCGFTIVENEENVDPNLFSYRMADSPWVSPVHCVPKKGGLTVVENEEKELILTRFITGWGVCIDYRKLNEATGKDHFPLPFMDQMLERLAENEYYCFLDGVVLGQHQEKHFRPIHYASKTITEAESNYTMTEKEMLAVVFAFKKFRSYLIMNKSIVYTDHSTLKYLFAKKDSKARLLRWVLLLQEFKFKVMDTKGAENQATDHLSRLENPPRNVIDPKEINEAFPLETLNMVSFCGNSSTPCITFGTTPSCSKSVRIKSSGGVFTAWKPFTFSRVATMDPPGDIMVRTTSPKSDSETHFCKDQYAKVMLKYGVTHRLATAYHAQTSGQVEVSNHGLKKNHGKDSGQEPRLLVGQAR
nr:reverse transcriptase domain-containing protein [Tanacetum cinerariifolium]